MTKEQMIELIATKCMGWRWGRFGWLEKAPDGSLGLVDYFDEFDPLTNISQAVEAMKNSGYKTWTLEFFLGKFLATIYDNNDCDKEIGKALDANECKALMYALVEAIGGKG